MESKWMYKYTLSSWIGAGKVYKNEEEALKDCEILRNLNAHPFTFNGVWRVRVPRGENYPPHTLVSVERYETER